MAVLARFSAWGSGKRSAAPSKRSIPSSSGAAACGFCALDPRPSYQRFRFYSNDAPQARAAPQLKAKKT